MRLEGYWYPRAGPKSLRKHITPRYSQPHKAVTPHRPSMVPVNLWFTNTKAAFIQAPVWLLPDLKVALGGLASEQHIAPAGLPVDIRAPEPLMGMA